MVECRILVTNGATNKIMKKTVAVIISSALGMSLLSVAPALAQGNAQGPNQGPRPGMMRIWGHRGDDQIRVQIRADIQERGNRVGGENGSEDGGNSDIRATMMNRTLQQFMGQGLIQGRGEMIGRSVGGKVTAVSASNFRLEIPAMPRQGTTTVNVVTNASTTFLLGKNSASISDVAVGSFALVAGPFASSTQTITALRVNLSTSTPPRGQEIRIEVREAVAERFEDRFGTTTPRAFVRGVMNSMFQGLARFFGR